MLPALEAAGLTREEAADEALVRLQEDHTIPPTQYTALPLSLSSRGPWRASSPC